jgi:hypothetical protein
MTRVAILANCQGQDLLTLILALKGERTDIAVRHILNYVPSNRDEDDFITVATHVVYQVTWNQQSFERRYPGQIVIYFPGLRLDCLYPFAGEAHPRNYAAWNETGSAGPFDDQLGDKQLNRIMSELAGAVPEKIYDRFISLDYANLVDLDRIWERDRSRLERLGEIAGLDILGPIDAGLRLRPVFWTNLHPVIDVVRYCYMHIMSQLPLDVPISTVYGKAFSLHDSLDPAHAPVHPSVAKHFGIHWADGAFAYRQWLAGSFTHREWTLRYIRFDHNPALDKARVDLICDIDVAGAVDILEAQVASGQVGGQVYHLLSIGYWKVQRQADALAAALRAIDSEPLDARFNDFLNTLVRLG